MELLWQNFGGRYVFDFVRESGRFILGLRIHDRIAKQAGWIIDNQRFFQDLIHMGHEFEFHGL